MSITPMTYPPMTSNMSGSPVTWMSKLVWLVVKLLPVTTNKDFTEATFKLFSFKTFAFCLFFIGPVLATTIVLQMTGVMAESLKQMVNMNNIIDQGSVLATFASFGIFILSPFLVSSGIPAVSMIALASDLRWPKYGLLVVVATILNIVGHLFSE